MMGIMEKGKMKEELVAEEKLLTMELKRLGRVVNKEGDWEAVPENLPPEADENDLADKFEKLIVTGGLQILE